MARVAAASALFARAGWQVLPGKNFRRGTPDRTVNASLTGAA
jgi:hypothetical protein